MGQIARIRRNYFFAFLSQLTRILTTFALFVGIARIYGPEGFGQFTTAHTLSTVFLLLADFGFDVLLSAEISRQRERLVELAHKYLSMKILFGLLATILMMFTIWMQQASEEAEAMMYVFTLYVLLSSLLNFFFALFKSLEVMHHETRITLIVNVVILIGSAFLGLAHAPLLFIALVFVGSRIVGLVLAVQVANKYVPLGGFRLSLPAKSEISTAAVFGFHALCTNLYFVQDTLLLAKWSGDHEVGLYQSVFKLVSLSLLALDISFYALLPVLSRLHRENRVQWLTFGRLLNKLLWFAVLPFSLVMIVFPADVIELLYGLKDYREAVPVLQIFGLIILIKYTTDASATMLTSSQRQSVRLLIVSIAVVVNGLLNAYCIPRFGIEGAALVSLATNIFVASGYVFGSRDISWGWFGEARMYIPLATAGLLGLVFWGHSVPFWMAVPFSVIVLSAVAYFLGFSHDERSRLFSLNSISRSGV